jgi:predicted phage terminase large subunit-like protein
MNLADLNPFETLREIERVECEASLYEFVQKAWKYVDPSPFTPGWPLEAMCEHLEAVVDGEIRKLIINIPPRCGKSSIVSVCVPAWVWTQREISPTSGPQVPLLHASYAMSLAMRDSVKTRRLVESPWYQRLWGHRFHLVGDQNTKGRFQNDKRGERLITAVDARVTGEGGNIIVVDDPNAANEAMSEALIETTNEWWDGTMSTRLNDARTGAYVVIQQRLGEEDLTGHILDTDEGWTHLMLPMEFEPERAFTTSIGWDDPRTEEGELLWPERFAEEQVEVLKKRLGPWKAAGQLQQRPEPKGGGIIKRDWWQLHDAPHFPQFDYVVASLDTAFTTKQENDFSALTVWGIFTSDTVAQPSKQVIRGERLINVDPREYGNQAPKVMLMNAWQERLELHDLVMRVQKSCKEMKVDRLLIEDKAAGHSVAQELRRLFGYDGFAVQLVNPGALDKVARVYAVQHLFAEGMIFAPNRQWAEMTIGQTTTFPRGKHDDLVDTVSQALTHLRQAGMLTRSSEHISEVGESLKHRGAPPASLYGI